MDRVDIGSPEPLQHRVEGPVPAVLFERALGNRIDAETERWLVEGLRKFDRLDGALPLERCLGLPTTAQRRRAERDFWLRTAAATLIDQPKIARAREVARELSIFMSRGKWREWHALTSPPDIANELDKAFFYAARAIGNSAVPEWRQISRVLGVVIDSSGDDNDDDRSCNS